jgi:hypothetical protein
MYQWNINHLYDEQTRNDVDEQGPINDPRRPQSRWTKYREKRLQP